MDAIPREDETLASAAAPIAISAEAALRAFPETPSAEGFYPEPTRIQCLNLLLQLVPYTNEVVVVGGPEGFGKSALLARFAAQGADSWLLVSLAGQRLESVSHWTDQLASGFGFSVAVGVAPEQLLAVVLHRCNELHEQGRHPILVVDDAHRAAPAVWQHLSALAQAIKQSGSHLSLLLAVEPASWDTPELRQLVRAGAHRLDLAPLDAQEEMKYIHHRLAYAELPTEALGAAELSMIERASGGNFARVNALARQRLLRIGGQTVPAQAEPAVGETRSLRPQLPVLLAAAVLVTGVVSAVLFRDAVDRWLTGAPDFGRSAVTPAAKQPAAAVAPPSEVAATLPAADAPPTPAPAPEAELPVTVPELQATAVGTTPTLSAEVAGVPAEAASAVAEPESTVAAPSQVPEQLAAVPAPGLQPQPQPDLVAPEPVAVPATMAAPQPPVASLPPPEPITTEPMTAPPLPPGPAREDWLMAQPPTHYTLQLMALSTEAALLKALAPVSDKSAFAYYRLRRKDTYYYALVYGTYPSSGAAQQVAADLPKALGKVQPWVRKFKSVQDDIRALQAEAGGVAP